MSLSGNEFQMLDDLKNKGNQLFVSGDYLQSIKIYSEILNHINSQETKTNIITKNDLTKLKLQTLLNRSASYIKLKEFNNGLLDCNNALDIDNKNIKGLFRKATCLINITTSTSTDSIKNLNLAIEELKKALYIDNENNPIKELLSKTIILKNELIDQYEINKLPSEMLKYIKCNINSFKELHDKWLEFYKYILSNGTHDIIINNNCCQDLIYIFERFIYISDDIIDSINNRKDSENHKKLYYYIIFNSWNTLSLLVEENDIITGNLEEEINDPNHINNINSSLLQLNKIINFNSNNNNLNKFRSLIRINNNIINFTKIKDFINNINPLIQENQLKTNLKQLLNSIFNVLICTFNYNSIDLNDTYVHIKLLTCIINNNNQTIKENDSTLYLLVLRNLSIIFQQIKSKGTKIEALDYNNEVENLINSLFSLSYYSFKSLFEKNYCNNDNYDNKILQSLEFILTIIFSLISEKERSNNQNNMIDIHKISNNHIISKYLLNSIKRSDNIMNQDQNQSSLSSSFSNWIAFDFINFINGLIGLKILHYSNKQVLKGFILNYPQIIHCILLIVLTNYSEYNSILHYSLKNQPNFNINENFFNDMIKPWCIEILSLLMEYREIRSSIVKDDDTIILIYNICKNIIISNNNKNIVNMNELDSCCRLLNGISKTTMENNDILDLFINQLDILSLLEHIWIIFQNNNNKLIWSCIQNSFEIFTILTMHNIFKSKLLNYKMKNTSNINKNDHLIKNENSIKLFSSTENELFIINLLNLPEIYDFNKNSKYFSNTFLYLYVSFIQNLLTSNYSDPSSESKNNNDYDEFKSVYFLKRQRFYGQYNSENHVDFDQSQMEQLEMMYKQLPEYTRNERNGHYDRGDEILADTFRKLIIEKSNIISFMYIILEKNIINSNNKNKTISSSLPFVFNIANNIVDLIVNTENLNEKNLKEILSLRGKIIQNGGLKCLLDSITIIDNELLNFKSNKSSSNIFSINKKYLIDRSREYKQAISKLLIYISPALISYKLLVECAIKIQSLLEDDHELLQYESALAITNILSKSFDKISQDSENDSISIRIYNNGLGWSLLKSLCFTDNNFLRAAGLEGLCNFCNKDYVVLNHFISSKSNGIEDLKLFIAFSQEQDNRIQIAALGALAMLSSYSDVSKIIIDNWNEIGVQLIQVSEDFNTNNNNNIEIKERLLFCLNNLLLYTSSQNNNNNNDNDNNSLKINKNQVLLNIHKSIQDCIMSLE
ncbi:TPR repeat-containing [Cryptosporidium sp. chipmunk genotype I]|uniref:TPR repeat-containing n=1 Tax=Cryptosporidium sp. chipmunk genotype I TaxID=1280935 RepID=UPI00351A0993|nr:TPR repeat-containing [Cryptosporidium sp. chipmunk genotype I]